MPATPAAAWRAAGAGAPAKPHPPSAVGRSPAPTGLAPHPCGAWRPAPRSWPPSTVQHHARSVGTQAELLQRDASSNGAPASATTAAAPTAAAPASARAPPRPDPALEGLVVTCFKWPAALGGHSVSVCGSFSDWEPVQLHQATPGGDFVRSLALPPGPTYFKVGLLGCLTAKGHVRGFLLLLGTAWALQETRRSPVPAGGAGRKRVGRRACLHCSSGRCLLLVALPMLGVWFK